MIEKKLIIIAGWYFYKNGFYESIIDIASKDNDVDVFISSHKKINDIDSSVLSLIHKIPRCTIIYFENYGYDWGMYSKAISFIGGNYKDYKYICFIQDDVEIIDLDFLNVFINHIESKNLKVLGNSFNVKEYPFKLTHPHVIEWLRLSEWQYSIKSESWSTVRGSFFVVKSEIFDFIKSIPYKIGHHSGFGNWGVISFSGMVSDLFGINSISTISNEYLRSDYIIEYYRGEKQENDKDFNYNYTIVKRPFKIHLGCGQSYMDGYLNIDHTSNLADIKTDILSLEFDENSLDEVLMYHVIEHFNRFDADKLIKNIYKWLKKDSALIIECPDIEKVAILILENKRNIDELENGAYGIRGFYGEPFPEMNFGDYHKWGYSEFTLKYKLFKTGFSQIRVEKPQSHGKRYNRDLRIVGIK